MNKIEATINKGKYKGKYLEVIIGESNTDTKIILDGKELTNVMNLDIHIDCDMRTIKMELFDR